MPDLRLSLLGPLEIEYDGRPLAELTSLKAQALLTYLVVTSHPQSRQKLAGLLWTDVMERSARTSLRTALSQLRKAVGDIVLADHQRVYLNPDRSVEVDVHSFEQSCRRILVGGLEDADSRSALRTGLDHYRGEFLSGFPDADAALFEEWVLRQREHYHGLALDARQRLADDALSRNAPGEGIADARRALALDPLHEPAHRTLMALYTASGQRAAALRQYEECVRLLAQELAASPSDETVDLYFEIQHNDSPRSGSPVGPVAAAQPHVIQPATPRHNLPAQTTPFIGREVELEEVTQLFMSADVRLVNIVGPGGMGKTRLAQEVAANRLSAYAQGVHFVELAPLTDVNDIPTAVADALKISLQAENRSQQQQLMDYLAERQIFLVLDNFEHVLEGAELVTGILQAAPMVKVLVTSRQRLHLSGETVFDLGGMPYPEAETATDAAEPAYSAVRLFVQSAQRIRSAFDLDADNAAHVARVCRLVHGMPLAILLAAAWVDVLSVQEIADEIERSLDFLATELRDVPARQRSIRAVFVSSWQRLSRKEQAVFMRLAVFRGGVTRAAAESVAQASLPILSRLVSGSLLQRDGDRQGRYQIHELLRQYAEEELRATSQWEAVRDVHSAYFADHLAALEPDLKGRRQLGALQEIEADWENVRAAWQWAVQRKDYATVDRALESLYWYCLMRSRLPAGQELLQLAQRELAPAAGTEPHPVWGRLMARAMKINIRYLEPVDEVKDRVEIALAIAERRSDRRENAFCLWAQGMAFLSIEDPVQALPYFETSLAEYQVIGDQFYVAWLLYYVGLSRRHAHLPSSDGLHQSLEIRRALGDHSGVAYCLHEIGTAFFLESVIDLSPRISPDTQRDDQFGDGESYIAEAYAIHRQMENRQGVCENLPALTALALRAGDLERTAALTYEMLEIADDMNSDRHRGVAHIRLGEMALLEGDIVHSRRHFERALDFASGRDYSVTSAAEFGLSQVALEQGDSWDARQHLRRALDYGIRAHTMIPKAEYVIQAALLLAPLGHLERAASLLALASNYAAIVEQRHYVGLRSDLEAKLAPADFAAAWARGQDLQWEETRDELIAQFSA